ncbi:hypothetical protein FS837_001501, partial [Tulasnella sp. UAMH 9824]
MHSQQRRSPRQIRLVVLFLIVIIFVRWWRSSRSNTSSDDDPFEDDRHGFSSVNDTWPGRAERVKQAFLSSYHAYEESAFGQDELSPVSKKGSNNFNGWGVSIIDSMDTILLMELKPEYKRALEHVTKLRFSRPFDSANSPEIHFFETTIRYLGGFLSAYTLTSDKIFLTRADELAQILLPAFQTQSGLPSFSVDFAGKKPKPGPKVRRSAFSEMTSFGVEFLTLAKFTGKRVYRDH